VLIPAFAFGGIPMKAVTKAFREGLISVSPPLLNEYRYVPLQLFRKKKIDTEQFRALIAGIAAFVSNAAVIFPEKNLYICRDPKDNIILNAVLKLKRVFLLPAIEIFWRLKICLSNSRYYTNNISAIPA